MGFQPFPDGVVELGVAVRVDQFVWVFQGQAGEWHFLRDAAFFTHHFRLTVDGVLVRSAAVPALRCARDEQRPEFVECRIVVGGLEHVAVGGAGLRLGGAPQHVEANLLQAEFGREREVVGQPAAL